MKLYHGTNKANWALHVGACLTNDPETAAAYGRNVHEIEIDGDTLRVDVAGWDRDNCEYPGDRRSELDAWAADGYALVRYEDEAPNGRQHSTWRVCSLDAVVVSEAA